MEIPAVGDQLCINEKPVAGPEVWRGSVRPALWLVRTLESFVLGEGGHGVPCIY